MARFIQATYPVRHAGLLRVTRGLAALRAAARDFDGARSTATLLLAAVASALIVVANEVVTTWTDGHLLAAWIATWLVGFAALALLFAPARRAAVRARAAWAAVQSARRQRRDDGRLWRLALDDARVMAELSRTMNREALAAAKGWKA